MSTSQDLLHIYEGEIVPRSFSPGFVVLSYVVSFMGAASTLELIYRRTSRNGLVNHGLLVGAAVTMGGIAIWSMHYIGNRAVILADDQDELQIAYSSGFTAISFFLPILVLLTAFVVAGTNHVSWWRICGSGFLAGAAICGMHYLGNASISNYTCEYAVVNVVGAALIAVAASIVALSTFFVFRAAWTSSWWKRSLSGLVLACAVSGMHWCAATGTNYRLVRLNASNQLPRSTIVVIVICLSAAAALIVAGVAIQVNRSTRSYASKARQVALAAAIFDSTGRILVNPDGLLPSEKITDTYIERTSSDTFSTANPLFHWMFQVSRDWDGVRSMLPGMINHLNSLPKSGRDKKIRLIGDDGQLVDNYDIVFRELFCLAATNLADKVKENLASIGILWDEILFTGAPELDRRRRITREFGAESPCPDDLSEKGLGQMAKSQGYGRGSLLFLVRRVERLQDVEKLEAAGYRFADVHQVCGIIGARLQIKTADMSGKLLDMARYAAEDSFLEPGVHVGFFGIKARVGGGFDVLARRDARNLLPTMQMPLARLEPWQLDVLRHYDGLTIPELSRRLGSAKGSQHKENFFCSQLMGTIEALRAWMKEPLLDEAVLTAKTVQVPCRPRPDSNNSEETCTIISLRLMIPIHAATGPECDFVPLSFFKVHQVACRNAPQHAAFLRDCHRELIPVLNTLPVRPSSRRTLDDIRLNSLKQSLRRLGRGHSISHAVDVEGIPIPAKLKGEKLCSDSSGHSDVTLKRWKRSGSDSKISHVQTRPDSIAKCLTTQTFGGILVSQEIKVDVQPRDEVEEVLFGATGQRPGRRPSQAPPVRLTGRTTHVRARTAHEFELDSWAAERGGVGATIESSECKEITTFVDELFALCVDAR